MEPKGTPKEDEKEYNRRLIEFRDKFDTQDVNRYCEIIFEYKKELKNKIAEETGRKEPNSEDSCRIDQCVRERVDEIFKEPYIILVWNKTTGELSDAVQTDLCSNMPIYKKLLKQYPKGRFNIDKRFFSSLEKILSKDDLQSAEKLMKNPRYLRNPEKRDSYTS